MGKIPLLVTGSARLDAFRRTGDALTGRHHLYRLHPVDPAESKLFLPDLALDTRLKRLRPSNGSEYFCCPGTYAGTSADGNTVQFVVGTDPNNGNSAVTGATVFFSAPCANSTFCR